MVLVDTSVWSLALRRSIQVDHEAKAALASLVAKGHALMLGAVRQEVLSGITSDEQFDALRLDLRAYPDVEIRTADHEDAAHFFNLCRGRGIQGSQTDFLICAVAARRDLPILTVDHDFPRYASVLPIRLHPLPGT